jgi:hypothetical protein
MPLRKGEDFGTNADGGKSNEYCFHCFQNSRFLDEGVTLQEKIEKNVRFAVQMGIPEFEAGKMASSVLSKMKRWRKTG